MGQTPAGWYPNGDQWETYWDGAAWTDQHRPRGGEVEAAPETGDEVVDADLHAGDGASAPLLSFVSHIAGKNARVHVWPDRVEWDWRGRLGAGAKAGLAFVTLGTSYLATGVTRKQSNEVIPVKSIMSVTTRKGKGFQTIVQVITSGNTIDMRIGHREAEQVRALLMQLASGTHPSQQAVTTVTVTAPAASTGPDLTTQLTQLASLRDAGILTEEEFAAKKADILARI